MKAEYHFKVIIRDLAYQDRLEKTYVRYRACKFSNDILVNGSEAEAAPEKFVYLDLFDVFAGKVFNDQSLLRHANMV